MLDTIGDDLIQNRDAAKAAIAAEFSEMKKDLYEAINFLVLVFFIKNLTTLI